MPLSPPDPCRDPLGDVLDRAEALARLEGDAEILAELFSIFVSDAADMRERLTRAAAAPGATALQHAAHNLKGASGTLSARHVERLAGQIEQHAREGREAESRALVEPLLLAFDELVAALSQATRNQRPAA